MQWHVLLRGAGIIARASYCQGLCLWLCVCLCPRVRFRGFKRRRCPLRQRLRMFSAQLLGEPLSVLLGRRRGAEPEALQLGLKLRVVALQIPIGLPCGFRDRQRDIRVVPAPPTQ